MYFIYYQFTWTPNLVLRRLSHHKRYNLIKRWSQFKRESPYLLRSSLYWIRPLNPTSMLDQKLRKCQQHWYPKVSLDIEDFENVLVDQTLFQRLEHKISCECSALRRPIHFKYTNHKTFSNRKLLIIICHYTTIFVSWYVQVNTSELVMPFSNETMSGIWKTGKISQVHRHNRFEITSRKKRIKYSFCETNPQFNFLRYILPQAQNFDMIYCLCHNAVIIFILFLSIILSRAK